MMRRLLTVAVPVVLMTTSGPAALAAWTSTGDHSASLTATSVNAGETPSPVRNLALPGSVALSWAASTLANGDAVAHYDVVRDAGGSLATVCSGVLTTSCADPSPVPGPVTYSVVPRIGTHWTGPASTGAEFQFDIFAPTTVMTKTPVSNAQGWNTGDVLVELTATDPEPIPSGVKEIHYTVGSGAEVVVPGGYASFTVSEEQQSTIGFWAVDNLGNSEAGGSGEVKIDKTPPVSSGEIVDGAAVLSATDAGGSGVAKIEYRIGTTGAYSIYSDPVPLTSGQTIYFRAFDYAGNQESPDNSRTRSAPNDTQPPSTIVSSNPVRNSDGWTNANTTLTLTSTDNVGVAKLEWRIGTSGDWTTITGPGPYVLPQFTTEGETTIQYQATDTSNNTELFQTYVVKIDKTSPTVTGVSSTAANGTYRVGSEIPVTVTFSEPVTVTTTSGTPQLALATENPASTPVNYSSGSGTNTLTFKYTVAANNSSVDLNYVSTSSLTLNGGTIKDAADNDADRTLPATTAATSLAGSKNIVIDGVAPRVSNVQLSNGGTLGGTVDQGDLVRITFSEKLDASTICASWSNSSANDLKGQGDVVVTITDSGSNDILTVRSTACSTLQFGSVALGANYVETESTFSGSTGNTRSEVSLTGSSPFVMTVKIGQKATGTLAPAVALPGGTPIYTPSGAWKDIAGNAMPTTQVSGTASRF